jgi:hypothetical protein
MMRHTTAATSLAALVLSQSLLTSFPVRDLDARDPCKQLLQRRQLVQQQ